MIKRLFWIFIAITAYVYFISTDGQGTIIKMIKHACYKVYQKTKDSKIEVNKLKKN